MSLWGKNLSDYLHFVRTGIVVILVILVMGVIRFIVGASGVPYDRATHLVSMTIVTLLAALIYGQRARASGFGGYRHLLPLAILLAATMYGFIIVAILVEGLSGIHGYFHSPGAGQAPAGMGIGDHIVGQLMVMPISAVVLWGVSSLGFLLSRQLGYLRNAFLMLAALAVLRMLVGALGVPYAIGTWPTSLTLMAMGLSFYYGYRAPSRGLSGYGHMLLVGALMAACLTLLVVYGILVTEGLDVANYFHAPGEGFQPAGMSSAQHILGHFQFSIVAMVFLSFLAVAGFAAGKRKASTPAPQAA
ncbi:MAG: hypothetical protein ACRD1X_18865 [Vicinamibacteria bacterium]